MWYNNLYWVKISSLNMRVLSKLNMLKKKKKKKTFKSAVNSRPIIFIHRTSKFKIPCCKLLDT